MNKSCPCRSANDTSPNCKHCVGKRTGACGYKSDGSYGEPGNRQNYNYNPTITYDLNSNKYAGQDGNVDPYGYADQQNNHPYGTDSDYSSYPSQKGSSGVDDEANQVVELNKNNATLLRAAVVFSVGCFLTTQLNIVASELG